MKNNNSQVVSFGENCCTPVGQIKRYVDCIGCDRKPKSIHQQIIDLAGGEERCKELLGIKPKQETLEEAAEKLYPENWESIMEGQHDSNSYERNAFIKGAKWQSERMYSEEETYRILHKLMMEIHIDGLLIADDTDLKTWFQQNKKKQ
jgi:hypothetical protein